MLLGSILSTAAMLGVAAASAGIGNNYFYMGCYGYTLQADASVVPTKYSYPSSGVSTLNECATACSAYYAWIVGDGNFCYCLKNRSLFLPGQNAAYPYCTSPCPGNKKQLCGGAYGSGEFSLFEQA